MSPLDIEIEKIYRLLTQQKTLLKKSRDIRQRKQIRADISRLYMHYTGLCSQAGYTVENFIKRMGRE